MDLLVQGESLTPLGTFQPHGASAFSVLTIVILTSMPLHYALEMEYSPTHSIPGFDLNWPGGQIFRSCFVIQLSKGGNPLVLNNIECILSCASATYPCYQSTCSPAPALHLSSQTVVAPVLISNTANLQFPKADGRTGQKLGLPLPVLSTLHVPYPAECQFSSRGCLAGFHGPSPGAGAALPLPSLCAGPIGSACLHPARRVLDSGFTRAMPAAWDALFPHILRAYYLFLSGLCTNGMETSVSSSFF